MTNNQQADSATLRARVAELVAALRPFAAAAPLIEHARGTFGIWARCSTIPGDSYTITVQHIRDAAAALARAESSTPAPHADTVEECTDPLGACIARAELRAIYAQDGKARHD